MTESIFSSDTVMMWFALTEHAGVVHEHIDSAPGVERHADDLGPTLGEITLVPFAIASPPWARISSATASATDVRVAFTIEVAAEVVDHNPRPATHESDSVHGRGLRPRP